MWKPLQNLGRVVFENLEAVDTPDDHTAVFHFAKPTPFQLIRNALPARHQRACPSMSTRAPTSPTTRPTSQLDRHRPVQVRRAQARRILPAGAQRRLLGRRRSRKLDEIVYRVLPDRAAAAGALEAEEIHLAAFSAVPLADLERISKVAGIKVDLRRAMRR